MQIVELLINASYVFGVYVQWKTHIPIICVSNNELHMFLELNVHKLNYK